MAFTALIPSAGRSSRMGTPKAWLLFENETLLQRIVRVASEAGALAVVVVAGAEEDPALVTRIDVATRIVSPTRLSVAVGAPDGALIASIRAGYELVRDGSDILLWPVDAPFATAAVVRALVEALGGAGDKIAVPTVGTQHGHPVLLGGKVAQELVGKEADEGAHLLVRKDPSRVIEVKCTDVRLSKPLNTPHEARALGIRVPTNLG